MNGTYRTATNKWNARIATNGVTVHLGTFETQYEAAKMFDAGAFVLGRTPSASNFKEVPRVGLVVEAIGKFVEKGVMTGSPDQIFYRIKNIVIVAAIKLSMYIARPTGDTSSKGAYPANGKWNARIAVNGQTVHLGSYNDSQAASEVYDAVALLLDKPKTRMNYPSKYPSFFNVVSTLMVLEAKDVAYHVVDPCVDNYSSHNISLGSVAVLKVGSAILKGDNPEATAMTSALDEYNV